MVNITRPLLAGTIKNIKDVKFPVLCTPKLDGIRCLKVDGKILTRKFKPLPNKYIQESLSKYLKDGMDGEIIVPGKTFNEVQSLVMTEKGQPSFEFHCFDYVKDALDKPYTERMSDMAKCKVKIAYIKFLFPVTVNNQEELDELEAQWLEAGYEGVMLRSATGKYKCGRSSVKEGILCKLKRFSDSEAKVIGFEEQLTNTNAQEKNEFGLSKRSHKKEGMVPADTLGSLIVEDVKTKIQFSIGSGFKEADRRHIWLNKEDYIGKLVNYKYQEVGAKDAPRFPVFRGFRSELDT